MAAGVIALDPDDVVLLARVERFGEGRHIELFAVLGAHDVSRAGGVPERGELPGDEHGQREERGMSAAARHRQRF